MSVLTFGTENKIYQSPHSTSLSRSQSTFTRLLSYCDDLWPVYHCCKFLFSTSTNRQHSSYLSCSNSQLSLSQAHCSKHGQGIKSGYLSHSGSPHQLSICTKVMHKRGEEGSGICCDISYHAGAFSGASHVSVNSHRKQKPVGFWLAPKHWHYGTYLIKIIIMCFNSDNWTLISLQPAIQCHLGMRAGLCVTALTRSCARVKLLRNTRIKDNKEELY